MNSMNNILYFVMMIQFIMCFFFAYLSIMWQKKFPNHNLFVNGYSEQSFSINYISRIATFLIAYSQLIPISMYIGIEIIKLLHVPLIKYDENIFDIDTNRPTVSRTSELIDELGQVNYIFCDKTGTLTKNCMNLKKISIDENIFNIEELVNFK